MKSLFFNMLNASFYGSVMIVAVIVLRLLLKKAPRGLMCLMWLLVGIRLVLPFTIESRLSLQPETERIAQVQESVRDGYTESPEMTEPPVQSQSGQVPAFPQQPAELPEDVQIFVSDDAVSKVTVAEEPKALTDYGSVAAWVWAAGIAALFAYSTGSYWRLRRQVREAVRMEDGSWECPGLATAFVLGLFRPRIYLPTGLSDRDRELILAHERAHIARKDHWIKPVGYLVLMLHWFNPLVWLAYICLCRDVEMACDERVVKHMDPAARKDYSIALLNCSSRSAGIAACPVAFGEVGVKQRILGVLHYRKPGFWIVLAAAVALVFVSVCLMTNPQVQQDSPEDVGQTQEELPTEADGLLQKEETPLELCRQAVEEFQSRESGYVTWENSFSSNGVTQSVASGGYWFAGENWLRKSDTDMVSSVWKACYLGCGDLVYRSSGDGAEAWFAVGESGAAGLQPWIFGMEWDEETISLVSDEWENDRRQIILEVHQTPPAVVDGSVTQYEVTFRFDRDGRLLGTVHTYSEYSSLEPTLVVSTMNIPQTTGQNPEKVLAEAMEPLLEQREQELERCRSVLEEFQSLYDYHVVQQSFYAGSILNSATVTNYWRSGEDWLHIAQSNSVDNGHIVQRLRKDGMEYWQELYDTLTDEPKGNSWTVTEVPSDCMSGNWLGEFDWDNSAIRYLNTDTTRQDGTMVTLVVDEDPSAFGKYCPYEVQFYFESDGTLQSISLMLEENKGQQNWSITNSIYSIDYAADAAAQIDAACAIHDPVRVSCYVEDCDDPSHRHGDQDHH